MEYLRVNKIKISTLFFTIILPFFLLLFCLKGDVGNFSNPKTLQSLKLEDKIFEFSGHPFEFSRTRSLFSTTVSIANDNDVFLSPEQIAFAKGDIGTAFGKYFSWAPPGTAFIGAIFFKIFSYVNLGQFGAYLSILCVSVFIHYLIFHIVFTYIKKDTYTALLCSYIYTFGTIAFVYSITYFQHQYTVLFFLLMLLGIFKHTRDEPSKQTYSYLIPLLYGISAFFDYPNLVILLPLFMAYLFVSKIPITQRILRTLLCTLLPLLTLGFFQIIHFGSFFQTTNTLVSGFAQKINLQDLQEKKNIILNIFDVANIGKSIYDYVFSTPRGFFFFSPIMLFALLQFKPFFVKHLRLSIMFLLTIIITVFMYGSFSAPLGGWCFGPRYLLPIYLIFSILSGIALKEMTNKLLRRISLLLIILSIGNNLAGALTTLTIPETKETFFFGIKNLEFVLNDTSGSFVYVLNFKNFPLFAYYLILLSILSSTCIYFLFRKK